MSDMLAVTQKLSPDTQLEFCRSSCLDSDADLMKQVAAGQPDAFTEIVRRYGQPIGKLVGRLNAWRDDSEDILQEVFLVAWKNASSYTGEGSLEGWLKKIAVNQFRNHVRHLIRIRRKIERLAAWMSNQPPLELSFSKNQIDTEQIINTAMRQLPQTDRSLLVMYYLEEMTGEEVADQLNINVSTLHVRLHRARKRLETKLGELQDVQ